MPNLEIVASHFQPPYDTFNGEKTLNISQQRCLKTAMAIGTPVMKPGTLTAKHAVALAAYRAIALKVAIDFTRQTLMRPYPYSKMDQSEKSNVSFWTGMTFATIAANDILNVPRLYHAASMKKSGKLLTIPGSTRLADLVGSDGAGNWHVLEAKARLQNPTDAIRANWKIQAGTVATINGIAPATCSYCFCRVARTYKAELIDPPSRNSSDGVIIEIPGGDGDIVDFYYGLFRELLPLSGPTVERAGRALRVQQVAFDVADNQYIFVGMEMDTLNAISDSPSKLPGLVPMVDGADFHIGADGIAVLTSPTSTLAENSKEAAPSKELK